MNLAALKPMTRQQYEELFTNVRSGQLLPPLTDSEYADLKADIAEHGVLVPVLINDDGTIIDGHHRIEIARSLGIYCPYEIKTYDEAEARTLAVTLNTHRRHLNQAQKRDLLALLITAAPEKSDRQHAAAVGVHHNTVASVRNDLEASGEISQSLHRTGADGRTTNLPKTNDAPRPAEPDPARRPRRKPLTDEFETAMMALTNAAKRIKKLTSDDRWNANQAAILVRNGPELIRVRTIVNEAFGDECDDAVDYYVNVFGWESLDQFTDVARRRIAARKAELGGDSSDEL